MSVGRFIALASRALVSILLGVTLVGCGTVSSTPSPDQFVESLQNRNGAL